MKTAVIYARYSSDNQTEQSIDGQLRVCHEYAQRNDILILDTYIDRAMTGTNDLRPDFQRMLKNSVKREWNYVLVYKLDRFSRNKYEMAMHKKTLKDNGTKVISATEFIPDTPDSGYAPFVMIFNFFAKTFDVNVYSTRVTNIFISPNLIQKLFTCIYMVGTGRQKI